MTDRRARGPDYRTARIGAVAGLLGVLVLLIVLDAFIPSYDVDPIVLVAIVGAMMALLGVEAR